RSNQYWVDGVSVRIDVTTNIDGTVEPLDGGRVFDGCAPIAVPVSAAPFAGAVPVPYKALISRYTAPVSTYGLAVMVTRTLPVPAGLYVHVEPKPIMTRVRLVVPAGAAGVKFAAAAGVFTSAVPPRVIDPLPMTSVSLAA